jgi:hypothetical protein
MLHEQFFITRVLGFAGRLQLLDLGEGVLVHLRHQNPRHVLVIGRDAGHHVGNDQALEILLMRQRILQGKQTAPRLAIQEEVVPVQAEGGADLLHLVHEAVDLPQIGVVGLVTVVRAELVVVVILDTRGR